MPEIHVKPAEGNNIRDLDNAPDAFFPPEGKVVEHTIYIERRIAAGDLIEVVGDEPAADAEQPDDSVESVPQEAPQEELMPAQAEAAPVTETFPIDAAAPSPVGEASEGEGAEEAGTVETENAPAEQVDPQGTVAVPEAKSPRRRFFGA